MVHPVLFSYPRPEKEGLWEDGRKQREKKEVYNKPSSKSVAIGISASGVHSRLYYRCCEPLRIESELKDQNGISSRSQGRKVINAKWKSRGSDISAQILRKLFCIFIKEIIEVMMATILGMLGTYDFKKRILNTPTSLIEDDTYYMMKLLKKGASNGHGPHVEKSRTFDERNSTRQSWQRNSFYQRIPQRRSPHLTSPTPVPTVDEADDMILQDTIQVSLVEQSHEEQEAKENVELVKEHLAAEEIEKMVEEPENVVDDSSNPRNDEQDIPGTWIEPKSDKKSMEVEITDSEKTNNGETEITNIVIPVNVDEDEEEITNEVYELKRREKRKIVEESKSTPSPTPIRSPRIHDTLVSSDTEKLHELTAISTPSSLSSSSTKLSNTNRLLSLFKAKLGRFKHYKSFFQELQGRYGYLLGYLKARFMERKSFNTLADHLQDVMVESLPIMVDKHIKEQVTQQVPEQVRAQVPVYVAEGLILERQQNREEMAKMIDASYSIRVDASVRSYMSGHILHVHPVQPTTSSAQEQQYQLYLSMKDDLQLQISAVRPRDEDDPHDDAHPEEENSAKWQKTSEYEAYVSGSKTF
ncbi:hypothetical protein Tco_1531056 [Tanacetum coccineum]